MFQDETLQNYYQNSFSLMVIDCINPPAPASPKIILQFILLQVSTFEFLSSCHDTVISSTLPLVQFCNPQCDQSDYLQQYCKHVWIGSFNCHWCFYHRESPTYQPLYMQIRPWDSLNSAVRVNVVEAVVAQDRELFLLKGARIDSNEIKSVVAYKKLFTTMQIVIPNLSAMSSFYGH